MSQDENSNRNRDDRSGPSSSIVLLIGLLAITGMLLFMWIPQFYYHDLGAGRLKQLVEVSPYDPSNPAKTGILDVQPATAGKPVLRYSNLRDVTVRDRSI